MRRIEHIIEEFILLSYPLVDLPQPTMSLQVFLHPYKLRKYTFNYKILQINKIQEYH